MNSTLNNKQLEVINSTGPVLCIAGAGTGKTRVLTEKIYQLINSGVDQKDIYAFTFTNKAAHEMKSRVAALTHTFLSVTISTFHSFFFGELLTLYDMIGFDEKISIIDQEDEMKIIRDIIKDNNLEILDSLAYKSISNIKNLIPNKDLSLKEEVEVGIIFKKLQAKLREINRMDFNDILYYYYELINGNEQYLETMQEYFQYVLIDEAQDINTIQYLILDKLSKYSKLFLMVGDIDQCIYTFRGSNYSLIRRFQSEHHAKLIVLEENYRCTKSILNAANNLIKNNVDRFDKNLFTNNDRTFKVHSFLAKTDKDEAVYAANLITKLLENGYKHEDICVLYRNNQLSNNLEKELTFRKIPFTLHGSYPFFSHREIKSLINHYLFLLNNKDSYSLSMILHYPNKLLADKQFMELSNKQEKEKKSLFELINESNDPEIQTIFSYLQDLIIKFEELDHIPFFNYLLDKTKLLDAFKEEKNVKAKTARVLEFKTFIQDLSNENKRESIKEFIDNIYLQNTKDKSDKDSISMMTIHQSKGLEYKVIIILGCNQGILPSLKTKVLNNEEERRIFYVAITRAKERLFLLSADRRFINGKYQIYAPSDFLLEMNL